MAIQNWYHTLSGAAPTIADAMSQLFDVGGAFDSNAIHWEVVTRLGASSADGAILRMVAGSEILYGAIVLENSALNLTYGVSQGNLTQIGSYGDVVISKVPLTLSDIFPDTNLGCNIVLVLNGAASGSGFTIGETVTIGTTPQLTGTVEYYDTNSNTLCLSNVLSATSFPAYSGFSAVTITGLTSGSTAVTVTDADEGVWTIHTAYRPPSNMFLNAPSASPSPGETVTGSTSGATGVVATYDPSTGAITFSSSTGSFVENEAVTYASGTANIIQTFFYPVMGDAYGSGSSLDGSTPLSPSGRVIVGEVEDFLYILLPVSSGEYVTIYFGNCVVSGFENKIFTACGVSGASGEGLGYMSGTTVWARDVILTDDSFVALTTTGRATNQTNFNSVGYRSTDLNVVTPYKLIYHSIGTTVTRNKTGPLSAKIYNDDGDSFYKYFFKAADSNPAKSLITNPVGTALAIHISNAQAVEFDGSFAP